MSEFFALLDRTNFLRELKQCGLKGVQMFVSDKCLGLVENFAEFYPGIQLAALRGSFISQGVDCGANRQGERGGRHAEGDPRTGRCPSRERKSIPNNRKAQNHAAR